MNEKMKKEEDLDEDESVVVVLWFRLSDVRESVSRVRRCADSGGPLFVFPPFVSSCDLEL